jgi:hypothetical protein
MPGDGVYVVLCPRTWLPSPVLPRVMAVVVCVRAVLFFHTQPIFHTDMHSGSFFHFILSFSPRLTNFLFPCLSTFSFLFFDHGTRSPQKYFCLQLLCSCICVRFSTGYAPLFLYHTFARIETAAEGSRLSSLEYLHIPSSCPFCV